MKRGVVFPNGCSIITSVVCQWHKREKLCGVKAQSIWHTLLRDYAWFWGLTLKRNCLAGDTRYLKPRNGLKLIDEFILIVGCPIKNYSFQVLRRPIILVPLPRVQGRPLIRHDWVLERGHGPVGRYRASTHTVPFEYDEYTLPTTGMTYLQPFDIDLKCTKSKTRQH